MNNSNNEKVFQKSNINWYPGHMAKTKRQIGEQLNLIDVVYEVIDSRMPRSSKINDIDDLIKNKKRILIMTKSDLCDSNKTNKFVKYYESLGYKVLQFDLQSCKNLEPLINLTESIMEEEFSKMASKGLSRRPIRVLVVGVPNVGKSTLINRLVGQNKAGVGSKAGFTKQLSWIRVNKNIELLDSPGILWPKFEDQDVAVRLAFTGAISDDILDIETLAMKLRAYLAANYPDSLIERYKIECSDEDTGLALLEKVGKKRGMMITGGEINTERAAITVIDEFRSGKLGRITLESPRKKEL